MTSNRKTPSLGISGIGKLRMIYILCPRGTGGETESFEGWESLGLSGELSLQHGLPCSSICPHVSTLALPVPRHNLAMRQCGGRQCEQCVQTLIISRHRAKFSRDLSVSTFGQRGSCLHCLPILTLEWVHLGSVFIFYLKILPVLGMESWTRARRQQTMAGVPRGAGCPQ